MKKLTTVLLAALAMFVQAFSLNAFTRATAAAESTPTAYTVDFSDTNLEDQLHSVYIPTAFGTAEELSAHWDVKNDTLTRVNDLHGGDVTGNYAVTYFNGCYARYFELNTKVAYGERGLTGVVFGKKDLSIRHLSDGNAMYFMPDPCVELSGSTITQSLTSSKFAQKAGFYDVKMIVCADYLKVYIDGVERVNKQLPAELFQYGRIGLFTANTNGAFYDGVEVYNLDEHGNRIPFEAYKATTGVSVTDKTVEMSISDGGVKLNYSLVPADATVQEVRFLSASPDIAVVDNNGYIHGLKVGVTEIYVIAQDGGFKDSFIVTVTEIVPEVEGVRLDKTSAHIEQVGGKVYLSAMSYPEDAENLGFRWSSSNTKVAIVNNGTVTAMGEGTCTITVKDYYGRFEAKCVVTVGGTTQNSEEEKGGCSGTMDAGIIALAFAGATVLLKRKEK